MKQLKSELAALDRKITAELATTHEVPDDRKGVNHDENNGTEVKQGQSQQPQPEVKVETTVKTVNVHTTTLRRDISPRWLPNLNPVIQCRQVCRIFRLDTTEFDNPQQADQASVLGLSIVFSVSTIKFV